MSRCDNSGMECGLIDDEKEMQERLDRLKKLIEINEEAHDKNPDKEQWLFLEGLKQAWAIIGEAP